MIILKYLYFNRHGYFLYIIRIIKYTFVDGSVICNNYNNDIMNLKSTLTIQP